MKSIKPTTQYTRCYRGTTVQDYGWHQVIKKLRKRYSNIIFDDDVPLVAPLSKKLQRNHKIKVYKFPFGKSVQIESIYDVMEHVWHFYEGGYSIDIDKFIKRLK